ncbi:MAG TPA: prepilin-type N-terminal cleavage/methylation domain-containing protein [Fimbriimonadaceae bacterium]|nr:prepilin-type N-terminal cleavage/methylation domain-containing protein [Fimbriimonadaceae bacterium]
MKKAFTLIELLVVIAIIAILAAILFPVFAQAKMAAKKTADLSNGKQLGIGLQLYLQDTDGTYPPSNHRLGDGAQEMHWSWMMLPYVKNEAVFVSPADKIGGWAPGCFNESNNNRGFGWPSIQENGCAQQGYPAGVYTLQVARISYVANQSIIGRKRETLDTANVVGESMLDDPSGTIVIAPATEAKNCMRKAVGGEYRSYRPAFGIGTRNQRPISGSSLPTAGDLPLEALRTTTLNAVFNCETIANPASVPDFTLRYTARGRFGKGNNYIFTDMSAKYRDTYRTFLPDQFAWGKKAYSLGGATVVNPDTGLPLE